MVRSAPDPLGSVHTMVQWSIREGFAQGKDVAVKPPRSCGRPKSTLTSDCASDSPKALIGAPKSCPTSVSVMGLPDASTPVVGMGPEEVTLVTTGKLYAKGTSLASVSCRGVRYK